jgi:hypothetical protein
MQPADQYHCFETDTSKVNAHKKSWGAGSAWVCQNLVFRRDFITAVETVDCSVYKETRRIGSE